MANGYMRMKTPDANNISHEATPLHSIKTTKLWVVTQLRCDSIAYSHCKITLNVVVSKTKASKPFNCTPDPENTTHLLNRQHVLTVRGGGAAEGLWEM